MDQARFANQAVRIELLLSYFLSWLGIGWISAGKSTTGATLLVGNFALVIIELIALLANQKSLPSFSEGLWWVIPALLIQNIIVGTASAYALRRDVARVVGS